MHSATKWKSRLLAAAVAFATVMASIVGTHVHAACHQPLAVLLSVEGHAGADTATIVHHGGADGAAVMVAVTAHKQALAPAGSGQDDNDHTRHAQHCCGMSCHGGQGILCTTPFVAGPFIVSTPPLVAAAVMRGLGSGGLERPPKLFQTV